MKTDEVRDSYLEFFKSKGHTIYPSDSLVPENDASLLFTGAGMNQFKDMFMGKGRLPFTRATTSQKCIRTVDIEKVGKTASHHTFFEMLGNFSFGDYFKEEAITWAWEYLSKVLNIPEELLTVTIYEEDEEAFALWHKKIGLPEGRIYKFGADSNFWPANAPMEGPNGVCGPCSEIYYDRGQIYSCGSPDCKTGCSCNRYVEIWNLVFTQFERRDGGELAPLPKKNIDTGMGLERMTSVLQKVPTNFGIDIFLPIIKLEEELLGAKYNPDTENGSRMRRIADHVRAVSFLISDGILPSNESRGYVERRLLRRALRDGLKIGIKEAFLYKLVPVIADVMRKQYPEIKERRENIALIIKNEEERFLGVVDQGMAILDESMKNLRSKGEKQLSGEDAFKLYDTFGFPLDITEAILAENGFRVDVRGFEEAMDKQRQLARSSSSISKEIFDMGPLGEIKTACPQTVFSGYELLHHDIVKVLGILKNEKSVKEARQGDEVQIIVDHTPFYGESGGQAGDIGFMKNKNAELHITDAKKIEGYVVHYAKVQKGAITTGEEVEASVDVQHRLDIARNHTATHLLQNALRAILGKHVEQAGSLVAPNRLRFDFTHYHAVMPEELRRVEEYVNEKVMDNSIVKTEEISLETARQEGALAFFGEKYSEQVRLVKVGDYSKELCGGTHLKKTGQIGLFRIVSESSVASGTRRIEAVTGRTALQQALDERDTIKQLALLLAVPEDKLPGRIAALQDEIKSLKGELNKSKKGAAANFADEFVKNAVEVKGEKFAAGKIDGASMDDLRQYTDMLIKGKKLAGFLGVAVADGKVNAILCFRKDLAEKGGLNAKEILSELAKIIGGSGGGRPDTAMAGGKNAEKIDEMIDAFRKKISETF